MLVIGQGPIGLMHAVLAQRTGARVLTSDLYPERHAIAARYGLKDPIHAGRENVVERVIAATEGRGADAVILAVGGNALIKTAMDAVRMGGKVMLFAQTQHGEAMFDPGAVCMDEKTLMGSYSSSFEILDEVTDVAFSGYRNGFDLTQLISHRFSLDQAVEAIEVASHPKGDSMKIMLEPVMGAGQVGEIDGEDGKECDPPRPQNRRNRRRGRLEYRGDGRRSRPEYSGRGGRQGPPWGRIRRSLGRRTVEHTLLHGRGTMQAAVLHGREDIRIEEVPIPKAEAGELVVRVGAALTCGTDLKVFRRGYHARMIVPPALFGHELAGTVVQAGEGVGDFTAGDRVVALNSAPCGQCFFCERGQENLCDDILFNNGAYAEFHRVEMSFSGLWLIARPSAQ